MLSLVALAMYPSDRELNAVNERVDRLMAEATALQDAGRWDEADSVIAEAENIEDQERERNAAPQLWDLPIFAWAWREDGRDLRA